MGVLARRSERGLGLRGKPAVAFWLWRGLLLRSFGFFLMMSVLVLRSVLISLRGLCRLGLSLLLASVLLSLNHSPQLGPRLLVQACLGRFQALLRLPGDQTDVDGGTAAAQKC